MIKGFSVQQVLGVFRTSADSVEQRDGINAQKYFLYNTFTDSSNYERGKLEWSSNVLRVGTEKAGTGSARALHLQTDGTTRLIISATGDVSTSGTGFTTGNSVITLGANRSLVMSQVDGNVRLCNNAQSDFNLLVLGSATASFPALKRNGTFVETRLADDSAYAPHAMQYLDVTDGITSPAAASGRARIYVDTADGDLKVVFADGTIKTIVTDA